MSGGKRRSLKALLSVMLLATGAARAGTTESGMRVVGDASPPIGYVAFCRDLPSQCIAQGSARAERLTPERWREMAEANTLGNLLISPLTDLEYYQSEEVWALPGSYGDCEDYVLLKRKWLVERGWPTGALLITVAFDEYGEGHAVLIARTDRGDLVLDNRTNSILPWDRTPYRYVKRQSTSDPNRWVRVGQPTHGEVTASARRRAAAPAPSR